MKTIDEPMTAIPIPQQVPAKGGFAQIPGAKLGYWDTGGAGEPIVLLHPASGSALIWLYQQPVFANAGYRVVAYSRRNYYNSDSAPLENPGTASGDLHELAKLLGLAKFHLVASAAGGSVAADYALSHPERLLSLTVSSNNLAAANGYIADAAARMKLEAWDELPRWYRELGPSYRAINPEGTAKWIEINELSETGHGARQKSLNVVTPEKLEILGVPTFLMTGSADMFTPPSVQRLIARHIPDCQLMVAPECGHSIYWERPDLFNQAVLDFIGKHPLAR